MNLGEVRNILEDAFNKELFDGRKRNIVFWYDEESEFVDDIDELDLSSAKLLKLDYNNSFAIKYQLEKVDTESNYLIYANMSKPAPRDNWLLDILKYGVEFSTDKTTVIMRVLNAHDDSLRNVFKKYIKFFNNKERYKKFQSYGIQDYTEENVDVTILSTLCKLDISNFESVVKTLLMEGSEYTNKYWEVIAKFGDIDSFWRLVEKYYGFNMQERNLEKFLIFLTVTDLSYSLEEKIPKTWEQYVSSKKSDCIVFVNHFMNHSADSKVYDLLADNIEKKLNLKDYVDQWDTDKYVNCDTFRYFDIAIIKRLINLITDNIEEFDKYEDVIIKRRVKHWYKVYKNEYESIYWAIELFKMQKQLDKTIEQLKAYEFIDRYTKEYFFIDTAYRKFYAAFDKVTNREWLMELREKVENTYVNWYLNELSVKWSNCIEDELQKSWMIPGTVQEKDFYSNYIRPHVNKGERVFVIISDALRYEAARELSDMLNNDRKGSTDIFYMQGSIPSYTKLGMASLLPNKSISINEKSDILVDGINSTGTENRNKILSNYSDEVLAVQHNNIIELSTSDFRKLFSGKKLIYIYHNNIDARGDNASTEREVFSAVDETFEELNSLINDLINRCSATNIYVTADHGFVYKRGALIESDKLKNDAEEAVEEKRRFVLSEKDENIEGTLSIKMGYIFGEGTKFKTIVPRGVNRFKVQGSGANYVHGGASLQEIVIPVIRFKNDRSKSDKNDIKRVDVKLTNISRKITNSITYLEFFQTEKVEDKRVPLRLKLYFEDEEGNRISNENIIIADSKSEKPEERTYREKFTLKDRAYGKEKKYFLVLENEEETVEKIYEKIPFIIDLAISNDFGF